MLKEFFQKANAYIKRLNTPDTTVYMVCGGGFDDPFVYAQVSRATYQMLQEVFDVTPSQVTKNGITVDIIDAPYDKAFNFNHNGHGRHWCKLQIHKNDMIIKADKLDMLKFIEARGTPLDNYTKHNMDGRNDPAGR